MRLCTLRKMLLQCAGTKTKTLKAHVIDPSRAAGETCIKVGHWQYVYLRIGGGGGESGDRLAGLSKTVSSNLARDPV